MSDCDRYEDDLEFPGFNFGNILAGAFANLRLENDCDDQLVIEKLDCSADSACDRMSFPKILNSFRPRIVR